MVEISLSVTMLEGTESGVICVSRTDCGEPKELGKIQFESLADERWWMMVLMEMHSYVAFEGSKTSDSPELRKLFLKCCSH